LPLTSKIRFEPPYLVSHTRFLVKRQIILLAYANDEGVEIPSPAWILLTKTSSDPFTIIFHALDVENYWMDRLSRFKADWQRFFWPHLNFDLSLRSHPY